MNTFAEIIDSIMSDSDDERTARRKNRGQRKLEGIRSRSRTPPVRGRAAPQYQAPRPPSTEAGPPPPTQAGPPQPTQATQKPPRVYKLKRGNLEVIGRSDDTPMVIKMKCTLPSGQEKLICKF